MAARRRRMPRAAQPQPADRVGGSLRIRWLQRGDAEGAEQRREKGTPISAHLCVLCASALGSVSNWTAPQQSNAHGSREFTVRGMVVRGMKPGGLRAEE